jgi:hypothetical protein
LDVPIAYHFALVESNQLLPKLGMAGYDMNDTAGSTLTAMQAGMDYWIKMTSDKTLSVSGSAPSSSLSLSSGWNFVGYNGTSCVAPSTVPSGLTGGTLQVLWGYPSEVWKFYDPSEVVRGGYTDLQTETDSGKRIEGRRRLVTIMQGQPTGGDRHEGN